MKSINELLGRTNRSTARIKELLELDSADICLKPAALPPSVKEEIEYLNHVTQVSKAKRDNLAFERAMQGKRALFEAGALSSL